MSRPVVSDAAERLYDRLVPYQNDGEGEGNGWLLLLLCEAAAGTIDKSTAVLRWDETGSGWRRALDPARAPVWLLPWLSQFTGSPSLDGLDEAQRRAVIADAPSFRRGTLAALLFAIRQHHPEPARIEILERDNDDAYRISVFTYASQTTDEALTRRDILSQIPAGLVSFYGNYPGWAIGVAERTYIGQTIGDLEGDFATINDLELEIPT